MQQSSFNIVFAAAVLQRRIAKSGGAERARLLAAVAASGLMPGVLGLAVPFIVARTNPPLNAATSGALLTKVPNVIGGTEDDALAKIKSAGLVPVSTSQFTKALLDVKKGTVLLQDPGSGAFAQTGSDVSFTVGLGNDLDADEEDDETILKVEKELRDEVKAQSVKLDSITTAVEKLLTNEHTRQHTRPV